MTIANELTIRRVALALARTACAVYPLEGCGDQERVDRAGSAALGRWLNQFLPRLRCVVRLCEGRKDKAPWLPEGSVYGARDAASLAVDILADPVEGTGQLAGPVDQRTRGSSCVVVLAPSQTVAPLYSGCYAEKLVLPPDAPTGIGLDTPPGEIVRLLVKAFDRSPAEIYVWILDRDRNQNGIAAFRQAGATVRLIAAGDFEAHLRAGRHVGDAGPVHVSYGIGGLPEGVLVVPFVRWSKGTVLLRPWPVAQQEAEIRNAGCEEMLGREYDAHTLIRSDDCLMAVAGITDGRDDQPPLFNGIRLLEAGSVPCVTVLVASPALGECRTFEVSFEDDAARRAEDFRRFACLLSAR
jgi:fructose-1,6-bisphosphatase II / sedoheptulose-1,7-bisphosphatase